MAERRAPEDDGLEEDLNRPIEVAGVPLVVWAVRLTLFLLLQGAIVLASYAYFGFGTDPSHFGPGFRLDPIHASVNFFWGLLGSVVGFFAPRFAIDYTLAFAFFFTAFAALATFTPEALPMHLGAWWTFINWMLAACGWAVTIYAILQGCFEAEPDA